MISADSFEQMREKLTDERDQYKSQLDAVQYTLNILSKSDPQYQQVKLTIFFVINFN